ncbi:MAG: hypothetical protein JXR03_07585 [Cyclobacteriaceae bacterium]
MSDLFIVVEGDADEVFLNQLLKTHFSKSSLKVQFLKAETNGRSIKKIKIKEIETATAGLDSKTLFILDADVPDHAGTKKTLIDNFLEEDITLNGNYIFLLPNDSNDGCLEDLLLGLVTAKSIPIFGCFDDYKNCINQIDATYTKPDLKTKIFAYSEIITGKGGEKSRNYQDTEVWDLQHESLNPLVEFLRPHFT